MYSLKWILDIEQCKTSLQFTIPEKLGNKEEYYRSIHEPLNRRKGQGPLSKLLARMEGIWG